jgi:hypothetical protein
MFVRHDFLPAVPSLSVLRSSATWRQNGFFGPDKLLPGQVLVQLRDTKGINVNLAIAALLDLVPGPASHFSAVTWRLASSSSVLESHVMLVKLV